MHVLVLNCGSSSLKAAVIDPATGQRLQGVLVERIGGEAQLRVKGGVLEPVEAPDHEAAVRLALEHLTAAGGELLAVGHRVVHGGERFDEPTVITDEVVAQIEELVPLAPLHNPANLAGIRAGRAALPDLPHVAVFDTAFHQTLPRRARTYALPEELCAKHGIRRYGFHGPSHEYVAKATAEWFHEDLRGLRIITCHLGNGCSVAAVEYGRSVETSMGMTPLEGLCMGTRSGDVDPGILLHLMREEGLSVDDLDDLLNRRSGLAGISGLGNDMRDIEQRAAEGNERARLAIQVFAHRVRKYIGAYAAAMGGVDAIVFTGGIGENSEVCRHRIAQRLDFLGARLSESRNRDATVSYESQVAPISLESSRVKLLVVKTDEQRAIAQGAARRARGAHEVSDVDGRTIPIAISARHCHLTQETVERLFGAGHTLTPRNPLSQPGQFACEESVTVVGPRRRIERVRILGPVRSKNQVEVSRTDEFHLGLDAPVRASGDIENSPGCVLIGTAGQVELDQGVICAWRHIHMTPEDAAHFGVSDRDVVEVAVASEKLGRSLVFGDVLVRVKASYALEMHIDTDEGNAAELSGRCEGALDRTGGRAALRQRRTRFDQG